MANKLYCTPSPACDKSAIKIFIGVDFQNLDNPLLAAGRGALQRHRDVTHKLIIICSLYSLTQNLKLSSLKLILGQNLDIFHHFDIKQCSVFQKWQTDNEKRLYTIKIHRIAFANPENVSCNRVLIPYGCYTIFTCNPSYN